MKDEDINILPENTDVSEIDKLTGIPKPNDSLVFAIPMLSPYTTIQSSKYKVKLQSGPMKRGKGILFSNNYMFSSETYQRVVLGLKQQKRGRNTDYQAHSRHRHDQLAH